MEQIANYQTLSFLIMKHLKKGVFTNFFMSKDEAEEYIKLNNLKFAEYGDDLVFVREFENRFVVNFYLKDYVNSASFFEKFKDFSKPVVFELAYRLSNEQLIDEVEKIAESKGFSKIQERVKLMRLGDVPSRSQKWDSGTSLPGLKIETWGRPFQVSKMRLGDTPQSEEIFELFNNSFNEYYGCIPSKEMLLDDIKNNNLLVCLDNEKIVGVLRFFKTEKEITIKHLAVKSEYRGKNIGKMLVSKLMEENGNMKFSVWTGSENKSAINVYKANGFEIDNYRSRVYMRLL